MKRMMALLLSLLILFSLAACSAGGSKVTDEEAAAVAAALVQGKLDSLYLNRANADYMELAGLTEQERGWEYEINLDEQVGYFARTFSIALTDDTTSSLAQLWKSIYAEAGYTVGEVSPLEDGKTYAVHVEIRPLDIIQLINDNLEEGLKPFTEQYGNPDLSSLSEAQAKLRTQCILDLAQDLLPQMDYLDTETMAVLVTHNDDGSWTVSSTDIYTADEFIVYFP